MRNEQNLLNTNSAYEKKKYKYRMNVHYEPFKSKNKSKLMEWLTAHLHFHVRRF